MSEPTILPPPPPPPPPVVPPLPATPFPTAPPSPLPPAVTSETILTELLAVQTRRRILDLALRCQRSVYADKTCGLYILNVAQREVQRARDDLREWQERAYAVATQSGAAAAPLVGPAD